METTTLQEQIKKGIKEAEDETFEYLQEEANANISDILNKNKSDCASKEIIKEVFG
jgi:hypothetical protein